MKRIVPLLVILLANLLSLKLYYYDELTLYIHPRYIAFTFVMNLLSLIVVSAALIYQLKQGRPSFKPSQKKRRSLPSALAVMTAILIVLGLVVPAKPLLSSSANQRSSAPQAIGNCPAVDTPDATAAFGTWYTALSSCDDPTEYQGREVVLEGFVYESGVNTVKKYGIFLIGRFKVSCCAVDAYPMSLPIKADEESAKLPPDQWVRVEGTIQPHRTSMGTRAVIEPTRITEIPQPEQPYEFIQF